MNIDELVDRALQRRASLLVGDTTDACRLFHGSGDGLRGLVIERFADVLIVQCHEEQLRVDTRTIQQVVEAFRDRLGIPSVYRKHFLRDRASIPESIAREHHGCQPWIGEPQPQAVTITENNTRFIIRPYDGFAVGLFLEQRTNRQRIRELASGRRVLNAFSYTGGFSVAAALGGASQVDSVDLSKRYLEWSKANFAANGLDIEGHWFFCSDVLDFYRRARRQERRYDLIVLDPPSFSRQRRPKREFVLSESLEELVDGAAALLDEGGVILLATNHREINIDRLDAALIGAAASRRCVVLDRPALPIDFPGDPDYSKSVIARIGSAE